MLEPTADALGALVSPVRIKLVSSYHTQEAARLHAIRVNVFKNVHAKQDLDV